MIEIQLQGRLGNQMFQYAYARALAERLGCDLKLDLSAFRHPTEYQLYQLWVFEKLGLKPLSRLDAVVGQVAKKLRIPRRKPAKQFLMQGLGVNAGAFTVEDGTWVSGWFQSLRYFDSHPDLIRSLYDLRPFAPTTAIQSARVNAVGRPLVALHVRRGDYVGNSEFYLDDYDAYYARAIAHVTAAVGADLHFIVISDDPDWCATWPFLKAYSHEIHRPASGETALHDMALMAACDHNIISNSTFSWWGAWLGDPSGRVVTLPKQWLPNCTAVQCGLDVPGWAQV